MKTFIVLVHCLLLLHPTVHAQSSVVGWSAFSTGYAASTSVTGNVRSILGQTFVGSASNSNTILDIGFFADPSVRGGVITGVEEIPPGTFPLEYRLEQNYPNPFNPLTVIRYQLPLKSFVTLKIYNILGQEVRVLVNGLKEAGDESVEWNAGSVASGMYFYKLDVMSTSDPAKSFSLIRKMMLLK
jgi:hypothetical protein